MNNVSRSSASKSAHVPNSVKKKIDEMEIRSFVVDYMLRDAYGESEMIGSLTKLGDKFTTNGESVERVCGKLQDYELIQAMKKMESYGAVREAMAEIAEENREYGVTLHMMGLQLNCLSDYLAQEINKRSLRGNLSSSLTKKSSGDLSEDVISNLRALAPTPRQGAVTEDVVEEKKSEKISVKKQLKDRTVSLSTISEENDNQNTLERKGSKRRSGKPKQVPDLDLAKVREMTRDVNNLDLSKSSLHSRRVTTERKSPGRSTSENRTRSSNDDIEKVRSSKRNTSTIGMAVKRHSRALPNVINEEPVSEPLERKLGLKTENVKTRSSYMVPEAANDLLTENVIHKVLHGLSTDSLFNAGHFIKGLYALMKVRNPAVKQEEVIAREILKMELEKIAKVYRALNEDGAVHLKETISTLAKEAETKEDGAIWTSILKGMKHFEGICLVTLQKAQYPVESLNSGKSKRRMSQGDVSQTNKQELQKFFPWKMKYDLAFASLVHELRGHQVASASWHNAK